MPIFVTMKTKQPITTDDLKRRILTIKSKFPFKDYATIYQYEYGKLKPKELEHLYRVWNLVSTDQNIVNRFEKIIESL